MDESSPPPGAGMDEPQPSLSDDLDEVAVEEIVQRTWPNMQGSISVNSEQVLGHDDTMKLLDIRKMQHSRMRMMRLSCFQSLEIMGLKERRKRRFSCLLPRSSCF
jgi:hypothetical protein